MPRISFIVPLYNCLSLTQAMVASLQATLPAGLAHEIILIDDGSTDGTRNWLGTVSQPPFRVILNERNLGFAATNNRAAATAEGEFLVLLNNDLVLEPHWLEPMLAAHRSLGRRAGLVGNVQRDARTGEIDHAGIIFNRKAKPEHDRRTPPWLARTFAPVRRVPAVTAACVLISTARWRQLGGFDEQYVNGGEDVDLCFRARAAGCVNAVALRSVVRHHISSSAGRKLRDEANSERLARRWRSEFIRAASRDWCREYVEAIEVEPRDYDAGLARRLWLHAIGLSQRPPPEAAAALGDALELEFVRWQALRDRG
ncbi:MAG TPA: glycosyltransferase [Opitutaceae bacterium]|nr:glycosyltransferase [Opitutaceae bacterium]